MTTPEQDFLDMKDQALDLSARTSDDMLQLAVDITWTAMRGTLGDWSGLSVENPVHVWVAAVMLTAQAGEEQHPSERLMRRAASAIAACAMDGRVIPRPST